MLLAAAVGGVVVIACVQVAQPLDSRALCHPLTTYLTPEVTVRPSYPSEGHSSDRLKAYESTCPLLPDARSWQLSALVGLVDGPAIMADAGK